MASIGAVGKYFDEIADRWNDISDSAGNKHLMIAQLAGVHEGSRVLDIGCGTGIMERAYLELGATSIVALDLSEKMIEIARENFRDVSQSQLRFECADILDFDDNPFDCAIIYNAYPHILDKAALVKAIHGLLVPNGRFLVAHGMGREALNSHHSSVPAEVTSTLESAQKSSEVWTNCFNIDQIADTPFVYFFGGNRR